MSSWSRFFVRESGGSGRVRIRYASGVPTVVSGDADGDVCISEDGASSKVYQLRSNAWVELGAGGGGSLGYFDPCAPPVTANARDLEFNDAADLTTMVTWNPGNLVGYDKAISNSMLRLTAPAQAVSVYRMSGAYRDCPTSADWSCVTRVNIAAFPTDALQNPCGGGFLLFDSTVVSNPTTADFVVVAYNLSGNNSFVTSNIAIQKWDDYELSGYTQFLVENTNMTPEHCWLRLRWINSSTTLQVDTSSDGISWRQIFSNASIGLTPAYVGLCAYQTNGTGNIVCSYDFMRFTSSANRADLALGRVV